MYQLNGAIFLDAGNVWLLRNDPKRPGGEFKLAGLLKEIALGTGFGLRYDFGFIVLRGDLGILCILLTRIRISRDIIISPSSRMV